MLTVDLRCLLFENGSRLVGIDAEVCGIAVDPEGKSLIEPSGSRDSFSASANQRVLTVLDPESQKAAFWRAPVVLVP